MTDPANIHWLKRNHGKSGDTSVSTQPPANQDKWPTLESIGVQLIAAAPRAPQEEKTNGEK